VREQRAGYFARVSDLAFAAVSYFNCAFTHGATSCTSSHRHLPNRLAKETSPYLLQHANNPVDWYPWGEEALGRARSENRPILLSIGYSACHWCHVMERESFEDAETAGVMNEMFVNVKVDREERPDLDSIYMQAVQAMNGNGGWPMTVFLTPELVPFWAGTYFPPQDRHGMPSFKRVMAAVADAFKNRPDDVTRVVATMREMYAASVIRRPSSVNAVTPQTLETAKRGLMAAYDERNGGFGNAPKFPQAMAMEFLLTQWARTGDGEILEIVRASFLRMSRGGIYDHVGGGFARYSVDERWLVPHFEKMLYDNALLTRVGVHVWQASKDDEVRRVCEETLAWLRREMTSPSGGFYSTLDADSEGEEGKFYLWDIAELKSLLGADADAAIAYWGVTEAGNFEDRNILNVDHDRAPDSRIARARRVLYDARAKRVWPARDEKILASWNGLMLRAVCDAARAFDSPEWRALALQNGEFLFREMVRDGRVLRSHKNGVTRIAGFLEDHAAVALGALALYELTFDRVWLDRARSLSESIVRWFWDNDESTFYDTALDHEALVTRPRDVTDNATPSGLSLTIELFLRLGDMLGDAESTRRAQASLSANVESMSRYPLAFGNALTAADMAVYGTTEVAIVGDPKRAGFEALAAVVGTEFVPSLVIAGGAPDEADGVFMLKDRPDPSGAGTAYVCRQSTCGPAISDPGQLRASLARRAEQT
jgi:uncharacterized protein YyaL (SSP411 family)